MAAIPWAPLAVAILVPTATFCLDLLFATWLGTVDARALAFVAFTSAVGVIVPGLIVGRALRRHPFLAGLAVGVLGWTVGVFGVIAFDLLLASVIPGWDDGGQGLGVAVGMLWFACVLCTPITGLTCAIASYHRFQTEPRSE